MNPAESNWQPIVAREWNLLSWTYGTPIKRMADLYSPSVFGASQNLRCECGKLSGHAAIGDYCFDCNVFVTDDVEKAHRCQVGRMALAAPLQHPLTSETMIQEFPIAPIAYRRSSSGEITALGRKYESLARTNFSMIESLAPENREGYFERVKHADKRPLADAIRDVIGIRDDWDSSPVSLGRDDSLLSLVVTGLATLQPDVSTLVRCCGIVIKIVTAV